MIRGRLGLKFGGEFKKSIFGQCFVKQIFLVLEWLGWIEVIRHLGGVGLCAPLGADSCIVGGQKFLIGSAEAKWTLGRSRARSGSGDPHEKIMKVR